MMDFLKQFSIYMEKVLKKYKFQKMENKYDSQNFGNAYLIVGNDKLHLRLVKDRDQYFIDIRAPLEIGWHPFDVVMEFLGFDKNELASCGIEEMLFFLDNYYKEICRLFTDIEKKKVFEKYEANRNMQEMKKIFDKD